MRYDIKLTGADDLIAALKTLQKGVRNTVLRDALRKGARPLWLTARRQAPRDTGELRRSLGTRMRRYRKGHVWVIVIGPRSHKTWHVPKGSLSGQPRAYNPAKYAHLVEKGTRPHKIPMKRGRFAGQTFRHPGTVARPFMLVAWLFAQRKAQHEIKLALAMGLAGALTGGKRSWALGRAGGIIAAGP